MDFLSIERFFLERFIENVVTFSPIASCISTVSPDILSTTSPVFVSKSKNETSCLNIVLRYKLLILEACLSPVTIQLDTSDIQKNEEFDNQKGLCNGSSTPLADIVLFGFSLSGFPSRFLTVSVGERFSHPYKGCFVLLLNKCGKLQSTPFGARVFTGTLPRIYPPPPGNSLLLGTSPGV